MLPAVNARGVWDYQSQLPWSTLTDPVERALGDGLKRPTPAETVNRAVVRRSLAAAADLPAGTLLAPELLVALRPGTGIPASRLGELVGRRVARDVARGELLALDDLD